MVETLRWERQCEDSGVVETLRWERQCGDSGVAGCHYS